MFSVEERKENRLEILNLLYVFHHRECFNKKRETKINLNEEYDRETLLAVRYLAEKELITISEVNGHIETSKIIYTDITAKGIDFVESIGVKEFPEEK